MNEQPERRQGVNWKNAITLLLFLIALAVEANSPTLPFGPLTVIWPLILIEPQTSDRLWLK